MKMLNDKGFPYLIFVPKNKMIKSKLEEMELGDIDTKLYGFQYPEHKTKQEGSATLAFLKQMFDKRSSMRYDWVFATNKDTIDLDSIIKTYKQRWRIETGFRIQEEARIKTKTKGADIRFFYYAFEQALQFQWGPLFNEDAPFKSFLLQLYEASKMSVRR